MFRHCFSLIFCAMIMAGCASSLNRAEFVKSMEYASIQPVLVDVRTAAEFKRGHIPGAVNFSVFTLPFRLAKIPVDSKEEPLVVYCAHGPRAALAGFILKTAGFKIVMHLDGDMHGWLAEGLPLQGQDEAPGPDS